MGVLPRGDSKSGNTYPEPNKYTQSTKDVNGELQKYADRQDELVFVDCKEQLLKDGQASTISHKSDLSFTKFMCIYHGHVLLLMVCLHSHSALQGATPGHSPFQPHELCFDSMLLPWTTSLKS